MLYRALSSDLVEQKQTNTKSNEQKHASRRVNLLPCSPQRENPRTPAFQSFTKRFHLFYKKNTSGIIYVQFWSNHPAYETPTRGACGQGWRFHNSTERPPPKVSSCQSTLEGWRTEVLCLSMLCVALIYRPKISACGYTYLKF